MKIYHVTFIWTFMFTMNFELLEMSKKWSYGFFRPILPELGLFYPYFVCKSSFGVISMIKRVILDQSKPISPYLKIKKFKNLKFINCMFIIHKNRNNTSIQPILKSNSTSFMFNNIFYPSWGNGGTILITSWKCNFSIYLDLQVYYLDIQAITTFYAFYWLFMC